MTICSLPRLPSRACPRRARGQVRPSIHTEVRSYRTRVPSRRCRFARRRSIRSWRASSQSIAAYRSSSSSGPRSRLPASVSRALPASSPRAVASFEPGSRSRAAIIASTRARSGDGSGSISRSRRSWRTVPSTAATWPCGSERTTSKAVSRRGTAVPPLSRTRSPSTRAGGHLERLARVRFLTLPASR